MNLEELKTSLWGAAVLLRGKINATGYKEYIFPLVFFKRISDVHEEERRKALEISGGDEEFAADKENYTFDIPENCMWDDVRGVTENVGQALVTAWTRIEQANPDRVVGNRVVEGLGGIFGKRDHWTNKNILSDQTLSELVEHFSKFDLSIAACPADEMGQAYEYLVGKFADDAGNTAQEFYTNRTVVELMAEILEPKAGESIYDPTCGTGGMLISCIARCKKHEENWREIKAYGQEQNALTSSVARMNLFLHGVEEFRIINDDTLLRPGFLEAGKLKTFDVVLANPPYSIKKWNREFFSNDPFGRNFLGTPPDSCADYAFIQHILASMSPDSGRCAILLPHGVLNREAEAQLRRNLVELDWIETIIGLGRNLFFNSGLESCIMFCRKKKDEAHKGKILFIEAEHDTHRIGKQAYLFPEDIEKILGACRSQTDIPGFSAWVDNEEVIANNGNLNIKSYVKAVDAEESGSVNEHLLKLVESQVSLRANLAELEFSKSLPLPPTFQGCNLQLSQCECRRVKLGDVAYEYSGRVQNPSESEYEFYIGSDCIDGYSFEVARKDSAKGVTSAQKSFVKGDYLLVRRSLYGSDFRPRAPRADFDGCCSADILTIREKPDVIYPGYLIKVLYEKGLWDFITSNSTGGLTRRIKWRQLADYEFDLPPMERQKELAELLWAANDLKEKYKKMIAASDEMLKAKFREMFGKGDLVALSELGKWSSGGTPSRQHLEYFEGDINWYSAGELNSLYLPPSVEKITQEAVDNSAAKIWPAGSMLVGMYDTAALKMGILTEPSAANQACACIQPDVTKVDLVWLHYVIEMNKEEILRKKRQGTKQKNLSLSGIKELKVQYGDLALQRSFVAVVESAESAKADLMQSIAEVDAVIKGLVNG